MRTSFSRNKRPELDDDPTQLVHARVLRILRGYVSEPTSRTILVSCTSRLRRRGTASESIDALVTEVEKSLDLFGLDAGRKAECCLRLRSVMATSSGLIPAASTQTV